MAENPYQSPQADDAKPNKRRWIVYELLIFAVLVGVGINVAGLISKDLKALGAGIGGGCAVIVSMIVRKRFFPDTLPPKK